MKMTTNLMRIAFIGVLFLFTNRTFAQGGWTATSSSTTTTLNIGIGSNSTPQSRLQISDGPGGEQIRMSRGIGTVRFVQDINRDDLYLMDNSATRTFMFWSDNGNINVGSNINPLSRLQISDGQGGEQLRFIRGTGVLRFAQDPDKDNLYLYNRDASKMIMHWNETGKVGIGTTHLPGSHLLYIGGSAIAEQMVVKIQTNWPDYTFESSYNLRPLSQVETFIKENKHLPEIPSAKEVEANGINLGEMDALLLKKIEELTLYVIELKKEDDRIKEENELLKLEIQQLKTK